MPKKRDLLSTFSKRKSRGITSSLPFEVEQYSKKKGYQVSQ